MAKSNLRLINTAQVADRLGVTPETVSRWVKSGRIAPAAKGDGLRGAYFFTEAEVERVAAERAA